MTAPQFSRPGAIDLSGLRKPASPSGGPAPAGGPPGNFAFDVVGEESLRTDVIDRSMSVLVLANFWSEQVPASVEINATLTKLSTEFGGRFLFARINVDAQPELAEALRIPQLPLVVAALRGQLAPLVQDSVPEAEMRTILEQVIQAAVANGVAGVSPPLSQAEDSDDDAAEPPSKYPEAEAALMSGDLDTAIAEYQKALNSAPADAEASLGLAQARLLKRTTDVDPVGARAAAAASPDDLDAQILVADIDLLGGHVDDAFARLIDLVRRTRDDNRDAARKHLIELFNVVGDADPRVGKARSMLASALF
jgi:putative thioredoxin